MSTWVRRAAPLVAAAALVAGSLVPAAEARADDAALTNTAHLDFLLDTVVPDPVEGHTTYRLGEDPELQVPWTYADARDGGTFERIGGGTLDPATGDWSQGAFNADDVTRAAVVYLRHWRQTGDDDSRERAYDLLRATAYLQTATGPDAGNVVLWMQPDGELNPSAEPVELPDPSDSGPSYWLARTVWAYGEGYAAFLDDDPAFAAFLQQRMQLSVDALERQVLDRYGQYETSDGARVPAWLVVDGADASAEAVLGLDAYTRAAPGDVDARRAQQQLAEGIAAMAPSPDDPSRTGPSASAEWPFGAVLPWTRSRSFWHAWSSQTGAALARSSQTLDEEDLLAPALRESTAFDPTLITTGGPDNGWSPTPTDRTQIAYGVDSRLQSLMAVAEASGSQAPADLAAITAGWYLGTNASGEPVYDPATGVTYDGVAADGTVNRNSGAESTIHGLLSMLLLDAHPEIRAAALDVTTVEDRSGLVVLEAEDADRTDGEVLEPASAWTGESQYGGGALLRLTAGQTARWTLPDGTEGATVLPVVDLDPQRATSSWRAGGSLGTLTHRVGPQGVSEAPGALLPQRLPVRLGSADELSVAVGRGTVDLDAVLLRPAVSRAVFTGPGGRTELVSAADRTERTTVGAAGETGRLAVYDADGRQVREQQVTGEVAVRLPAGGLAVLRP